MHREQKRTAIRTHRRRLGAAAVLTTLAGSGCAGAPVPPASLAAGTPVILVSIDTLRSDHLPAYGYRGVETPAIDALRRDAILFERAYTHVPLTLPAHASLFTGALPRQHGVHDNAGYRLASSTTLAGILAVHGYATGGAVSALVLHSDTGIASGFDFWEESIELDAPIGAVQRPGDETLELVRPWLRAVALQPFLLFFHLYEPHTPYAPPEPFASRYESPYVGEVAAVDRVVGQLMAELDELEVYDRALIVLLSDHGEGLGDHGEQEHGVFLYREALQVPLLLKLPGAQHAGAAVTEPAQLIDLMPTVLALLGVPRPDGLEGASLMELAPLSPKEPAAGPHRQLHAETFYPRLHFGWSELRSVIEGTSHYIEAPEPELYDLSADPGEQHNLIAAQPELAARLQDAVARHAAPFASPAPAGLETHERLAALGYLSSAPSRGVAAESSELSLVDPKSQLPVLAALESALHQVESRNFEAAIPALRELLAFEPDMVDAWRELARALEREGRLTEALGAREEVVRRSGAAQPHDELAAARLLFELGRSEEAEARARGAADREPGQAFELLARMALAAGDLEEAEQRAERAVETRGTRLEPLLILAEIRLQRRELDAVLAVTEGDEDPRLLLLRAEALAALGRGQEATATLELCEERARRLASERPRHPAGPATLTRVHLLRGELDQALAALELAVERGGSEAALTRRLGLALARAGRGDEAVRLLEPLAASGDPAAQVAMGIALTEAGRHHEAQTMLERTVSEHPTHALGRETLGMVKLRLGAFTAAEVHLQEAVRLDPDQANAWNLLGVAILRDSGDSRRALAAWEQALELDPGRYDVLLNLGIVAADTGQADLARRALERFAREAPAERFAADLPRVRARLEQLGASAQP